MMQDDSMMDPTSVTGTHTCILPRPTTALTPDLQAACPTQWLVWMVFTGDHTLTCMRSHTSVSGPQSYRPVRPMTAALRHSYTIHAHNIEIVSPSEDGQKWILMKRYVRLH